MKEQGFSCLEFAPVRAVGREFNPGAIASVGALGYGAGFSRFSNRIGQTGSDRFPQRLYPRPKRRKIGPGLKGS
jgi:hypothetical protein